MPDHLGDDMRKVRPEEKKEEEIKCKLAFNCYKSAKFNPNEYIYIPINI